MKYIKRLISKLIKIVLFIKNYSNSSLQIEALNAAANAVIITDTTGQILWVNNSFFTLTGYTKDESMGKKIGNLIKSGEHNAEFYNELWTTIISGRIWKGIITNRRKDGTLYVEEQTITPVAGIGGEIVNFISIKEDITEKLRIEEALKQKNDEMERFFTVSLDLLCILDTSGIFVRVNRAWERTLGYSIDELEGKNFLDFIHPDDMELTQRSLSALTDQIPVLNFTNRYRDGNGSYRFIEWRSYPSGKYIYAAARDITDRINYEHELNKLAERLTLAKESAGIGIWDWDIKNNGLIWDHQMYKLYGLNDDYEGNIFDTWRKLVHPDDREYVEALFAEGVKKLAVFHADFRVVWPDGNLHFLEGHALVIRGDDDKAVRITGVTRDISESKKMEEKLFTLSTTDPLTSAYNRRYLLHVIDSEISRAARYNSVFSLIMMDIDHFKLVNDTYGHDAGDEVLKGIVSMMQKRIRKSDVLARWGGEEFIILLSGTNIENAAGYAMKLMNDVRGLEFERSGKITVSFGVTDYRLNETSDSLLKRVDELVYKAKNEGRNCIKLS